MGASDAIVKFFHWVSNSLSIFHEIWWIWWIWWILMNFDEFMDFHENWKFNQFLWCSIDIHWFSIDGIGSASQSRRISTKSIETVLNFNEFQWFIDIWWKFDEIYNVFFPRSAGGLPPSEFSLFFFRWASGFKGGSPFRRSWGGRGVRGLFQEFHPS